MQALPWVLPNAFSFTLFSSFSCSPRTVVIGRPSGLSLSGLSGTKALDSERDGIEIQSRDGRPAGGMHLYLSALACISSFAEPAQRLSFSLSGLCTLTHCLPFARPTKQVASLPACILSEMISFLSTPPRILVGGPCLSSREQWRICPSEVLNQERCDRLIESISHNDLLPIGVGLVLISDS